MSKLHMNAKVMKTQMFHKIKYGISNKALVDKNFLVQSFINRI